MSEKPSFKNEEEHKEVFKSFANDLDALCEKYKIKSLLVSSMTTILSQNGNIMANFNVSTAGDSSMQKPASSMNSVICW